MYLQHYLDHDQYRNWLKAPMPNPRTVRLQATQSPAAPYFANYVTDQLVPRYARARRSTAAGYKVRTTIDLGLQKIARDAIAKVLPPSIGPTAALVAIDAHTGAVLAMVGGRNYHQSQFNLATQGERQPGSSFKPFVLAAALRDGIAPSTTFVSHPVAIDAGGRAWTVNNFEHDNLGTIDLCDGDRVLRQHGLRAAHERRRARRTSSPRRTRWGSRRRSTPYFSIGLGGEPATPLEMARAYATLANGGYRLDSSIFRERAERGRASRRPSRTSRARARRTTRPSRGRSTGYERQRRDRGPDAPGRRPVRHRQGGAAARLGGRRQDGHDRELRRRLVRRLHARPRHGGLGRLPEQADPDD